MTCCLKIQIQKNNESNNQHIYRNDKKIKIEANTEKTKYMIINQNTPMKADKV